jgi:hypothetical protein
MVTDDRAAADVLFGIDTESAFGLAERGKVVELDLGAFNGEGLGFWWH